MGNTYLYDMNENRAAILRYIRGLDHSPTVREIAARFDVSTSTVQWHLRVLEAEGKLQREGKRIVVRT